MAILGRFKKEKTRKVENEPVLSVQGQEKKHPFLLISEYVAPPSISGDLFLSLREAIPIIDAAITKLVRLTGGFYVECDSKRFQTILDRFQEEIPSDCGSVSLQSFLDTYFEELLTFGTAVAEMVKDEDGAISYLYTAPRRDYLLKRSKTDFKRAQVLLNDGGEGIALPNQENFLTTALNAQPGAVYGTSILEGLPFVSSVLLKIYESIQKNWERVGNVRFAVTYKPPEDLGGKAFAKERAMQIANEWSSAMRSSEVRDFVSVGDVQIKAIGADNPILDSEIPVRQMLEQIVAKLSLPPFMLGLSWSTTERMAAEQEDVLTTELLHYRRVLTPVIQQICRTHLLAFGYTGNVLVHWNDITLEDTLDRAQVRNLDAKTQEILGKLSEESKEQEDEHAKKL